MVDIDQEEKQLKKDSIDNISKYIKNASKCKILSREEEKYYAKLAVCGDRFAKNKLVESNLLLVVKIAKEYANQYNNFADLIQEGNVGLLIAVTKFDLERGCRFSTYAGYWIRAYMLEHIFKNTHITKGGTTQEYRNLFWNLKKEQEKLARDGIEVTTEILAKNLNASENDIINMDNFLKSGLSVDTPIASEDGDNDKITILDMLQSASESQPDVIIESNEYLDLVKSKLYYFGTILKDQRDVAIYNERILKLSEDGLTLQQLADRFGLSKEYIRQLESKLMTRLKNYLETVLND